MVPLTYRKPEILNRHLIVHPQWDIDDAAESCVGIADENNHGSEKKSVVGMPCLGLHGQWGNMLLQYMFLWSFADHYQYEITLPPWPGESIFGLTGLRPSRRAPLIILDGISKFPANEGFPYDYLSHRAAVIRERGESAVIAEVAHDDCDGVPEPSGCVDLEGLFFVNTQFYASLMQYWRKLFSLAPCLREPIDRALRRALNTSETLIGVHIRMGDALFAIHHNCRWTMKPNIREILKWLDGIWKNYLHPKLVLCTDGPESVQRYFCNFARVVLPKPSELLPGFARNVNYGPLTPSIDYIVDWYLLTQCRELCISNSTFSFTAAMINDQCEIPMRPCWPHGALAAFDPWKSEPVLFREGGINIVREIAERFFVHARIAGIRNVRFCQLLGLLLQYKGMLRERMTAASLAGGRKNLLRHLLTRSFYLDYSWYCS